MTPRGRALALTLVLTAAVGVTLSVANAPLRTEAARAGIVSLELAGTTERARAVIDSWGPRQREAAAFGLGLDFLFLLLYPTAMSLAVGLAADRVALRRPRLALWGKVLALGLPVAAVLDAVENAALWRMLQLGPTDGWAIVAAGCAAAKFALVLLGLAYLGLGIALGPRAAPAG